MTQRAMERIMLNVILKNKLLNTEIHQRTKIMNIKSKPRCPMVAHVGRQKSKRKHFWDIERWKKNI